MLAFAVDWQAEAASNSRIAAARLAGSLCAGIGGRASAIEDGPFKFAYRPVDGRALAWRPARLDDGRLIAFHGFLDNADEIARALNTALGDPARLYGLAVARWGDEADRKIVGEYCAIMADPRERAIRLSRSPLRGPPLHYAQHGGTIAAASVPRALFAAEIPRVFNEARAADSALFNFTDEEATWFVGINRVALGQIVELHPGRPRCARRYYRVTECPPVRLGSDAAYLERARELLDEGVRAALAGAKRPGATLSGGLDSPLVAVSALETLPPTQTLPTFTFHPEAEWDGITQSSGFGDERAFVTAFAALHPRLAPQFTANAGYEHDHLLAQMFHLIGGAPNGLPNMYVFHGIFSLARQAGCDLLLQSDWGNRTVSNSGRWGFAEYLRSGRWIQLWQALARNPHDSRSMLRKFLALSVAPMAPHPLHRALSRAINRKRFEMTDLITPLAPAYRRQSGADARARAARRDYDYWRPRSRRHALVLEIEGSDWETGEIYQGFEQLYGIAQRDPTAYRPFAEFCFGLPTDLFLRDGEQRWLARQLNAGVMPEAQRTGTRTGKWDADWHLRIGRRRETYLAELDRIEADPRLGAMLDTARLRAALTDFPAQTTFGTALYALQTALPRLLMTARFIDWAEGRNR